MIDLDSIRTNSLPKAGSINFRTDPQTKKAFERYCKTMRLKPSEVLRELLDVFMKEQVRKDAQ